MVGKFCDSCGIEFETKTAQKTCGKQVCRDALRYGRYLRHWEKMNLIGVSPYKPFEKWGKCERCKKPFRRKVANQKYCNDPKCRKLRTREYEANRKNDPQRREFLRNYKHKYYLKKKV